ncbi:MAG TPA: hypothetical protein ENG16_04785 [Archaeoglobus sp.]|nr:hypothetical protein [Archaeoglobus sp.]
MNKEEVVKYVEEKLNDIFNYVIEKIKEIDEDDPMFEDKLRYIRSFINVVPTVFRMLFDPLPKIKSKSELKIYAQQILQAGKLGVIQGEEALKMLEVTSDEEKG